MLKMGLADAEVVWGHSVWTRQDSLARMGRKEGRKVCRAGTHSDEASANTLST